jgi:hypothetical protein
MHNKTKQQLLKEVKEEFAFRGEDIKDELQIIQNLRDAFLESELADDQPSRIATLDLLYVLEHTLYQVDKDAKNNNPKELPAHIIDEGYRYRKVRNKKDVISMQGVRIDAGSRWIFGSFFILEDEDQFVLYPYEPSEFEWDDLKK